MAGKRELLVIMLVVSPVLAPVLARSETLVEGRRAIVLANEVAEVVVDLAGGSIASFHLKRQGLNPLQWEAPGGETEPRPMGHFLCLDRWGAPSLAEQENGMPFHGEAARVTWDVLGPAEEREGMIQADMAAVLPLARLELKRRIRLAIGQAVFTVREQVTNADNLGRIYNMVQHPTIAPPFLDEATVVDANARKGFMQSGRLPDPEEPSVYWPQALKEGQPVDMRYLVDDHHPNVVSYVIDEEYGWTTATNASKGLLLGYIWKKTDYPWFNAWRHVTDGKPFARGLEFGTTGLHQPYAVLVAKGRIFGRALYEYIDAGQTVAKHYAAFLFEVPADYRGVARIVYADGRLLLRERDAGADRDLVMEVENLFPE